jgi:hypothetical protein
MLTESLKKILGAELSAQVEAALAGKGKNSADIDVVVGNDGTFVPADKHGNVRAQVEAAETTIKAIADALKAFGGSGDPAQITNDVKKAQETITKLQSDHQAEIAKLNKTAALQAALGDKAHDASDIISLLDLEKIELDDKGALKTKLDDLINPIRESKAYLFKEVPKTPEIKGAVPAGVQPDGAQSAADTGSLLDAIAAHYSINKTQ